MSLTRPETAISQQSRKNETSKKIALTDAIFDQLAIVNAAAVADPTVLRLSLDAKAGVKVGPFSRKGKNRIETAACDHDFAPKNTVIPYGIFLPEWDELFLYCTTSKVDLPEFPWYPLDVVVAM